MITRRKDYIKRAPSKDSKKIYILCEGAATETSYFSFFEGLSSNLQLIIIPPESGTDPLKLKELAERAFLAENKRFTLDFRQNDRIWFAIDTDSWADEGKIQLLREFCEQQNGEIRQSHDEVKPYAAWRVAQSNPCFETWLYFHHYSSIPDREDIAVHKSFKAFVDSTITGGFDFQKDPVKLRRAIINSKANFHREPDGSPSYFSTEQHLLGEEILSFVETELRKLDNKMG